MRLPLAALIVFSFGTGVAHSAEAVTYAGSIGSLPVILELTSPGADGLRAGRYAYLAKGGDIPLHGMKVKDPGALLLSGRARFPLGRRR